MTARLTPLLSSLAGRVRLTTLSYAAGGALAAALLVLGVLLTPAGEPIREALGLPRPGPAPVPLPPEPGDLLP